MPSHKDDKEALAAAKKDLREGKSPTTAAGEFVREEIHHVREGKHGAASTEQAIAIGLAKARRAGVPLKKKYQAASTRTGRKRPASKKALARHAKKSAARRPGTVRRAAAKKAARTRARAR
jgi:predicted homoserine dehydrogenase-like protein